MKDDDFYKVKEVVANFFEKRIDGKYIKVEELEELLAAILGVTFWVKKIVGVGGGCHDLGLYPQTPNEYFNKTGTIGYRFSEIFKELSINRKDEVDDLKWRITILENKLEHGR
jgi:hypothetical protein